MYLACMSLLSPQDGSPATDAASLATKDEPATRQPAAERAYQYLRARLFDGTYVGGTMLSEGEIAATLNMSRTPVHEALLRCEFEGHVRLYPRRGGLVLPVAAKEINDVLDTRRVIEIHAVEKACETGRLAPELFANLAEQEELLRVGRDEEFSTADRDFHTSIVAATGNALMLRAYAIARDVPLKVASSNLRRDLRRTVEIIDEHRAIAQGISDRDVEAAKHAVEGHLAQARESLLRSIS